MICLRRATLLAVGVLSAVAAALPGVGVSAGVGGGGRSVIFTQSTTVNGYTLTFRTDLKTTKLYEIVLSCPSSAGANNFTFASAGLRLDRRRFSGRVRFSHEAFSPKVDAVTELTPVLGRLHIRWSTSSGPVKGTISVPGCRNGKVQKVNARYGS